MPSQSAPSSRLPQQVTSRRLSDTSTSPTYQHPSRHSHIPTRSLPVTFDDWCVMFTTKLSRATPRATAALSQTTNSACSTAQQATRCLATRPSHQRRHSSSKASTPPDSTASGKPAPAAKSKGDAAAPVPAKSDGAHQKKRTSYRRAGGLTTGKRKEEVDQFAGLPSVPSLQGMENPDVVHST